MKDGSKMHITPELKAALSLVPFQLFQSSSKKEWYLSKQIQFITIIGKKISFRITLDEFSSIEDLFLDILHHDKWYSDLSLSERATLMNCVEFVFLAKDNISKDYDRRYQCYKQHHSIKTSFSEFNINAPDFSEAAQSMNLPEPKTATEALQLVQKFNYSPEKNTGKEFKSCNDLAWWALEQVIKRNKQLGFCKTCGIYFVKSQQYRKYCSKECANEDSKVGAYLGDPQIKQLSQIINQRFERKTKSNSLYIYNETLFEGDYNVFDLFSGLEDKKIRDDPSVAIFEAEHFDQMRKAYKRLYKSRYTTVKEAKASYLRREISEKQYKKVLATFLSWLENVVKQLSAFTLNR